MADWFAFVITIGTETINWLHGMQIMGVPLAGFIVACFLLGVLLRALIFKP